VPPRWKRRRGALHEKGNNVFEGEGRTISEVTKFILILGGATYKDASWGGTKKKKRLVGRGMSLTSGASEKKTTERRKRRKKP